MSESALRIKVVEEIQRVPEDKLGELYDFIHFFRVGLERAKPHPEEIMQFAGCWQNMSAEAFQEFLDDITERRHTAFGGRIPRESILS
jgi:hypothetical protein